MLKFQSSNGNKDHRQTVTFVCDKNGVVKDYIANRKAKSTGNALLKAAGN